MYSQFPKLQKKLDSLLWKFEQELQAAIEANGLEDVELNISEANFSSRSPVTKVAYYLRRTLDDCLNTEGEIDKTKISEEHIGAAQGLLKIGRYQETAINVLTKALLISGASAEIKKVKKLASEALSECGTEIISFDVNSQVMNYSNGVTNEKTMCIKVGTTQMLCSVDGSTQTATCPDGKSYSKGGWTAC